MPGSSATAASILSKAASSSSRLPGWAVSFTNMLGLDMGGTLAAGDAPDRAGRQSRSLSRLRITASAGVSTNDSARQHQADHAEAEQRPEAR